ncbi:MAG: IS200/IS605 family transposase [Deltaproteobacteria bacterium]|nr:MAG: IS200/IS605 family transposase [Deltaproteobacteria bacterium]
MKKTANLRSHFHCVYNLQYHLVLVTKYRKKCFSKPILIRLEEISQSICEKWACELVEFGGEADHIHLLLTCHPAMQMSKFINNLKTVSSRLIRKEFSCHLQSYYWKPILWTRAYCLLTTGGANIETIKNYIENQGKRNSRQRASDSSPSIPNGPGANGFRGRIL